MSKRSHWVLCLGGLPLLSKIIRVGLGTATLGSLSFFICGPHGAWMQPSSELIPIHLTDYHDGSHPPVFLLGKWLTWWSWHSFPHIRWNRVYRFNRTAEVADLPMLSVWITDTPLRISTSYPVTEVLLWSTDVKVRAVGFFTGGVWALISATLIDNIIPWVPRRWDCTHNSTVPRGILAAYYYFEDMTKPNSSFLVGNATSKPLV